MSLKRKGQRKKPAKSYSKMFSMFAGDQLAFLIRGIKGQSNGAILNVTLEGYLLDEDQDYVYFGVTTEEISGVIRKTDIAAMFKGSYNVNTDADFSGAEGTELQ